MRGENGSERERREGEREKREQRREIERRDSRRGRDVECQEGRWREMERGKERDKRWRYTGGERELERDIE